MNRPQQAAVMDQLEPVLVQRIGEGKIELPLLPQVAGQVMALTNDPSADAARLSALIHQDQSLAAHVLRIANSPAYMPRTPIVSLQHAVAMLGINLLSEIALTVSLKNSTLQVPGYEADVKQLWRHALASGLPKQVSEAIGFYTVYDQAPTLQARSDDDLFGGPVSYVSCDTRVVR